MLNDKKDNTFFIHYIHISIMKMFFNKISAFGRDVRLYIYRRTWATGPQRYLSIFGGIVLLGILWLMEAIPKGENELVWVWSTYKNFVGQYVTLSDKELIASVALITLVVGDLLRQPILWILFTIEGICRGYSPMMYEQRAQALMRLPVGETLSLMLKVIVISAIFWWFKS